MCLSYSLSKKESDETIRQARKRGYIRVYKVCKTNPYYARENRTGNMFGISYRPGLQKAGYLGSKNGGWYAFLTLKGAIEWKRGFSGTSIKTCYAKPQWIKRLGGYDAGKAGIFTHLVFPKWKKGDMTIREFKKICKEHKEK